MRNLKIITIIKTEQDTRIQRFCLKLGIWTNDRNCRMR
ncbi:hypothetical protein AGMMS50249_0810 [candidate division SR1 bacterium]|nr:hypothetical protein AGMMS50249_0810 [candidate division SR1 bacterium]